MKKNGIVYLVGGGPGDPGLITVKGLSLIEKADCIVYDNLAAPELLKFVRPGCELVFVGKEGGGPSFPQKSINRLLVKKASQGRKVVRLKGGDPFLFGRGGEEALFLKRCEIPFEVVPGVSSAIAVPAYAGIPVTHRKLTSVLSVITGHEADGKRGSSVDFPSLAKGGGTLVFLMGVRRLDEITKRLVAGGLPAGTPCALIETGTTAGQKVATGKAGDIAAIAKKKGIKPPSVFVVGKVVGLRKKLRWFESRPLFGKRIVVTRTRDQASHLLEKLSENGADTVEFPTIKIENPSSFKPLDDAIDKIERFEWVVFTSANGVKKFLERLRKKGRDLRALRHAKVCAIGEMTGNALVKSGIHPDYIPDEYMAEAVVKGLGKYARKGARFLIPRAKEARDVLPDKLRKMGGKVQVVEAYRTVQPGGKKNGILDEIKNGRIDMVTFTSSSTAKNFVSILGEELARRKPSFKVASIGPITTGTLRSLGYPVHTQADTYTIDGLVKAIVRYYEKRK